MVGNRNCKDPRPKYVRKELRDQVGSKTATQAIQYFIEKDLITFTHIISLKTEMHSFNRYSRLLGEVNLYKPATTNYSSTQHSS